MINRGRIGAALAAVGFLVAVVAGTFVIAYGAGVLWMAWSRAREEPAVAAGGYRCSVELAAERGYRIDVIPERIECVRE